MFPRLHFLPVWLVKPSCSTIILGRRKQDDVVADIERRLAIWTKIPEENGEDIQVLRYENGQEYGAHWDWFDDPVKHADQMTAGNRIATVLMYLSDVEEGGETAFPHGTYVNEAKQKSGQYSPCGDEGVAVRPKKVPPLLPCRAASFCGRTWHHCLRAHTTPAPLYAKDRSGSKLHRPHLHAHTPHTAAARQLANQRDSRMQRWCCQCTCQRGGIPGLQSAFPAGRMCTAPPSRFSS